MDLPRTENLLTRQYVKNVLDFSSQYGREQSGSYTVANVRGCPTNFPKYGDFLESCVLRTYGKWWNETSYLSALDTSIAKPFFISQDFIEVEFEEKCMIDSVVIYENYNPGAVVALYALDYAKTNKWVQLWSIFDNLNVKSIKNGLNRPLPRQDSRKFRPNLTKKGVFSNVVRIELEHGKLDYYTELDAIEIVGCAFNLTLSKEIGTNLRNVGDELFSMKIVSEIKSQDRSECEKENENENERVQVESDKPVSITDLPNEILASIIRLLDLRHIFLLRSTCRKFYQLCSDKDLFNKLDLKPFWNQANETLLETFCNLVCDFKELNLSWSKIEFSQIIIRFFQTCCTQLTVLSVENCHFMNANALSIIGHNCSMLKSLSIASCLNISASDQAGFESIAKLANLEILNLYRTLIDGPQMIKIVQSCKNLISVNLGACTRISEFDEVVFNLADYCDKIESLDLWRAYSLTSMGLRKIANNCPKLKDLDIGWWVTDSELCLISQKGLHIEQLDILGSRSISIEAVEQILKNCKNLKFFDISFCFYDEKEKISQLCSTYANCSIKTNTDSAQFIYLDF